MPHCNNYFNFIGAQDMVGRITASKRCLCLNPLNLWINTLHDQKELCRCDYWPLKWGDYPGGPNLTMWILKSKGPLLDPVVKENCDDRRRTKGLWHGKALALILCLWRQREEVWIRKWRWPVEAGKGKEVNSPLEARERNFQSCKTHVRLLPCRIIKIIHLYRFKPLNLQ